LTIDNGQLTIVEADSARVDYLNFGGAHFAAAFMVGRVITGNLAVQPIVG
jgi:hypothetical protein